MKILIIILGIAIEITAIIIATLVITVDIYEIIKENRKK